MRITAVVLPEPEIVVRIIAVVVPEPEALVRILADVMPEPPSKPRYGGSLVGTPKLGTVLGTQPFPPAHQKPRNRGFRRWYPKLDCSQYELSQEKSKFPATARNPGVGPYLVGGSTILCVSVHIMPELDKPPACPCRVKQEPEKSPACPCTACQSLPNPLPACPCNVKQKPENSLACPCTSRG